MSDIEEVRPVEVQVNMSPTEQLFHDMVVLLVDASQRLTNSADFNKVVTNESAKQVHDAIDALTNRWANLNAAPWSCGHVAGAMCAECYRRLAWQAHELTEATQKLVNIAAENANITSFHQKSGKDGLPS